MLGKLGSILGRSYDTLFTQLGKMSFDEMLDFTAIAYIKQKNYGSVSSHQIIY